MREKRSFMEMTKVSMDRTNECMVGQYVQKTRSNARQKKYTSLTEQVNQNWNRMTMYSNHYKSGKSDTDLCFISIIKTITVTLVQSRLLMFPPTLLSPKVWNPRKVRYGADLSMSTSKQTLLFYWPPVWSEPCYLTNDVHKEWNRDIAY